jgi:broad specificity phosphatase PhoE
MRVVLIRHGEPAATPKGTFLGRTDPPLGDEGQAQAATLAQHIVPLLLGGDSVEQGTQVQLWASPLQRAQETAMPIAAAGGWDIQTAPELAEIDFGAWDGRTMHDIDQRWDGAGSRWVADPLDHQAPGGESLRHVGARVDSFWRQQVASATTPLDLVLIVAHFCPLAWLGGALLGLSASRRVTCRLQRGQAGCIELPHVGQTERHWSGRESESILRWWGIPIEAGGFF